MPKGNDVNKCREILFIIFYLTDYCRNAFLKKIKCNSCKIFISRNVKEISEINVYFQGGLIEVFSFNDTTINIVLYNHVVTDKLTKDYSFLHSVNQRFIIMHITLNVLADYEFLFNVDTCDEGHNIEKIERIFA